MKWESSTFPETTGCGVRLPQLATTNKQVTRTKASTKDKIVTQVGFHPERSNIKYQL